MRTSGLMVHFNFVEIRSQTNPFGIRYFRTAVDQSNEFRLYIGSSIMTKLNMDDIEIVPEETGVLDILKTLTKQQDSRRIDDAFFVVNMDDIASKYMLWKSLLPMVQPFYAVKCNDDKMILQFMAAMGIAFDCSSKAEIELILSLGIPNDKIIYTMPHKPTSHIEYARDHGVDILIVDCEEEMEKIQHVFPMARLLIRLQSSSQFKVVGNLCSKFGCDIQEGQRLLKMAKGNGQNIVGVSFHVGWGCLDYNAYKMSIKQCCALIELGRSEGHKMDILDIGGGYLEHTFIPIAETVRNAIEEYLPNFQNYNIVSEPGTHLVQTACYLAAKIIGKRQKYDSMTGEKTIHYYLNEGIRGSLGFKTSLPDTEYGPSAPNLIDKKEDCTLIKSIMWGGTCEGTDKVGEYFFPEMKIGEWIYFTHAGAYTKSFQTDFNGIPRSKVISYFSKGIPVCNKPL